MTAFWSQQFSVIGHVHNVPKLFYTPSFPATVTKIPPSFSHIFEIFSSDEVPRGHRATLQSSQVVPEKWYYDEQLIVNTDPMSRDSS